MTDELYVEDNYDEEPGSGSLLKKLLLGGAVVALIAGTNAYQYIGMVTPMKGEIQGLQSDVETLQTDKLNISTAYEKAQQSVGESLEAIALLESKIQVLNANAMRIEDTLDQKEAELFKSNEMINSLRSELVGAQATVAKLQTENSAKTQRAAADQERAKAQRIVLENEIAKLNSTLSDLEDNEGKLTAELAEASEKLDQSLKDVKKLTNEKNELSAQKSLTQLEMNEMKGVLTQQISTLNEDASAYYDTTVALNLELRDLKAKLAKVQQELADVKAQYAVALAEEQSSNKNLVSELNDMLDANTSLHNEKLALEANLRALLKEETTKAISLAQALEEQAKLYADLTTTNSELNTLNADLTKAAKLAKEAEAAALKIAADTEQRMVELRAQTDAELAAAKIEVENYQAISVKRTNNKYGFEAQLQHQLMDEMSYDGVQE